MLANVWGVDYDTHIDDQVIILEASTGVGCRLIYTNRSINFSLSQPITKSIYR